MLVTACTPPSPEQQIAEAKKFQQKGDLEAAAISLKNALQAEPDNGEARLLLGRIFRQNGQPQAAEYHFRVALQSKVDPRVVLPLLVQTLFEQAEFRKVLETSHISDFGEAAQQPEVLSYRGHSQLSLAQPDDAAASFEESLKRKPEYAPALLGQARLAMQRRDAQQTRVLLERAIASDSSSMDAWLMKGDLERASRNDDAAVAAYQKALTLKPAGLVANINLASMHIEGGKLDLARKHVDTVLRVAPDAAAGHYLLGLLELQNKNYAAAGVAVQHALKAAPGYLPATALAGAVAYATGATDLAERHLGDALLRDPGNLYLRKLYAAALLKAGKVPQATKALEVALKAMPDEPVVLALYAEAKYQSNDIATARKYFELALKQEPRSPGIRTGLGLARLAAGETDRALADLEMAVGLGGVLAESYLARTLVSARQYDRALQAIARLETTRPKDPATYNLKGSALFAKGDIPAARMAFEHALELDPLQVAAAVNLAQLDRRENKPAAVRMRFERILERDPENTPALLALSTFVASMGDRPEALALARRAAQINPKAFGPALVLARLYFADEDYTNAALLARIAADASPGNAEVLNMLAYSQLRLGRRSQALDTYWTLVRWHRNSAEAHYALSGAQAAEGEFFAAERGFRKALELRPDFPEAIYALASVQLRLGRVADAGNLASETQKRMPKSALGFIIAGDAAMAEKRFDQGVRAYEAAFAVGKSRGAFVKLLGALQARGGSAAAQALTAEWLKSNPGDIETRYLVADAAIRSNDLQAAAEQYRYVLRMEPNKLQLLHNLGWVYEQLNDPRALELAEIAYRISPSDPGVLHNLGRLLIAKGDTVRAVDLLQKARLVVPGSQPVRYHLARAYVRTGDNALARGELEQVLRSREGFPDRVPAEELLRELRR